MQNTIELQNNGDKERIKKKYFIEVWTHEKERNDEQNVVKDRKNQLNTMKKNVCDGKKAKQE